MTIWCMYIILTYDSVWTDVWPQNKCRSLWPIFHGPVIVPYTLKTISCMNIIIWDYESVWPDAWPKNKCRSPWPALILRANVRSYWLVIPKYEIHTTNSPQDIRQNHWTRKYRSQWTTFILRLKVLMYTNNFKSMTIIKGKINGLWNIGHWPTYILRDLLLFRGQMCHTDS